METIIAALAGTPAAGYVAAALTVIGSLVTIASVITPLTKTPKDDEILAKVKGFLHRFSILKPKK